MKRMIEAVLFDLDDTLHDDTLAYKSAAEEVAWEVAAEHGIDALKLKNAYIAQAEGFWKQLDASSLSKKLESIRAELWRAALIEVGIHDEVAARQAAVNYNRYRKKYFKLFPGAVDLLRMLRTRDVKLGLVTNGFSVTHREKIALLQIGEYFDAIFIADEVGMIKPDPLLFAHACQKLERAPAVSAMVGDRYERDIRGAQRAGLFTVWMNIHGATLPPDAPAPGATVDTIVEVGAALGF
ncbi:MAG: HAD-IA family hydrolase [Candidatus Eremiobacteraeota bacterium]|nr:HAD-IA family hydrolase [Candidatus Eremiobacteraeota bacterium]